MYTRQVILYNDSPVATEFLCLLDTGARGSEVGVSEREGVALACTEGGVGQDRWREQGDAPTSEKLLRVDPAQVSVYECACVRACVFLQRQIKGWGYQSVGDL